MAVSLSNFAIKINLVSTNEERGIQNSFFMWDSFCVGLVWFTNEIKVVSGAGLFFEYFQPRNQIFHRYSII